jgi:hypothetical protein
MQGTAQRPCNSVVAGDRLARTRTFGSTLGLWLRLGDLRKVYVDGLIGDAAEQMPNQVWPGAALVAIDRRHAGAKNEVIPASPVRSLERRAALLSRQPPARWKRPRPVSTSVARSLGNAMSPSQLGRPAKFTLALANDLVPGIKAE